MDPPAADIIDHLLPKLDEPELRHKRVRGEVDSLKMRLARIQDCLGIVKNQPMERWNKEARDVIYHIEQVVDKFRARQLWARQSKSDDATAAERKDIMARCKYKTEIYQASRQFASDFKVPSEQLKQLIGELYDLVMRDKSPSSEQDLGSKASSPGYTMAADNPDGPVAGEHCDQDDPVVGKLSDLDGSLARVQTPSPKASSPGHTMVADNPVGPVAGELCDQEDPVVGKLNVLDGSPAREQTPSSKAVSRQSRVEKLVSILTDEGGTSNPQLKVASILGRPGVGKTTLADKVYKRLMPRFECSAWVTVATKPDVKTILRNMLSQITPQGDASFGSTIDETIDEIRKALKNKRCFIVFDNMCDSKPWEIIKSALVDASNLSAILMTSRKVFVARYACGIIYRLKSHSDIASKKRIASGSRDNWPPQLASIPASAIPSANIHATNSSLLGGKSPEDGDTFVDTNTVVQLLSLDTFLQGSPGCKGPEDGLMVVDTDNGAQVASILPRVGGTTAPGTLLQISLGGNAPEDGDTVVDTYTSVHVPSVPPRVGGTPAPETILQGSSGGKAPEDGDTVVDSDTVGQVPSVPPKVGGTQGSLVRKAPEDGGTILDTSACVQVPSVPPMVGETRAPDSLLQGSLGGKAQEDGDIVGPVAGEHCDQDDPVVGKLSDLDGTPDRVQTPSSKASSPGYTMVADNPVGPVAGELCDQEDPVVGKLSVLDRSPAKEQTPSLKASSPRYTNVTIISRQSRVEKLVSILTDEGGTSNPQLKVASILGRPGVGKTTLADMVYKRLMPRFECSAWVTVATKPDIKNILRSILSQITPQGDASCGSTIDETIDEIRKALKDKRCFIVFDNMCDNKPWEIIKSALADASNLSVILMTSRKVFVARYACGIIYRFKSHADIASKKMLRKRITSGSRDNWPPQLANIPRSAIPSVIIHATNSSLLGGKAPEDGDTVVNTNTGVHVPFVPPRVGGTRAQKNVEEGLSMSNVPRPLKPCLMFLSMFQKGHEISTDSLVRGWIAEGFIPGETENLWDQGESYIKQLIERKFLVAIEFDASGKPRSVRLQDDEVRRSIASLSAEENSLAVVDVQQVKPLPAALVHRLSIQGNNTQSPQEQLSAVRLHDDKVHRSITSLPSEENPITVVDGQQVTPSPKLVDLLSIQGNNIQSPQGPLSRLRSLVVFGDANPFHPETGGMSLSKFDTLSVLDLGGCASLKHDHLKGIERLIILKYLVLGGDCITQIPKEIGSLVFLQTLDLRATRVKELPDSIALARKLKCLLLNWHTKIPDAIGKMEALEVLGDINISRGKLLEELGKLHALRVLKIVIWSWDDTCDKQLFTYLGSLGSQQIQCLSIFISRSLDFLEKLDVEPTTPNPRLQELVIRHSTFMDLPIWISKLTNISSLSIEVHKLSQPIIDMLGQLASLVSLFLTSKHAPHGKFGKGFINLTTFRFVSSALGMIFELGCLEKLQTLHLSFQASLTKEFCQDFNFGLESLSSSLKNIHVEIICFNASSRVVQDIEKAINTAIQNRSSEAELVIDEVRKEDMEKNKYEQETQGCSPVKYLNQIKKFNSDQRQALEKVGFGDLLKMKGVKIDHELCKRLAEAYVVKSEEFNIEGSMVQISIEDVGRLMGIPSKGNAIVELPKVKNVALLRSHKIKNGTVRLDTFEDYLSNNKDSDQHFIRTVLLYTIGMLLCPTAQRIVSSDYLSLLENVEEIKTVNWASLTLHHLKDSLKRYKAGKGNIEGNLVLLQLWYWENISKPKKILAYSTAEDVALVCAWKRVPLDAVTSIDQNRSKYWQQIEDEFHRNMTVPSTLSWRSLWGRYDEINQCCTRWNNCLEQARNAHPSGCSIDDYDRIAHEIYEQMPESEGKPFELHHCLKMLKPSKKC